MLNQFNRFQSHSKNINLIIGKLLKSRTDLLSTFVDNVSSMPFSRNPDNLEKLQLLGEDLMEYGSQLHFHTLPALEGIGGNRCLDRSTLAAIEQTTSDFVRFHDDYFLAGSEDDSKGEDEGTQALEPRDAKLLSILFAGGTLSEEEMMELVENLHKSLSALGTTIDNRIALEDHLFRQFMLHLQKTRQIAPSLNLSKELGSRTVVGQSLRTADPFSGSGPGKPR